MTRTLVGLLATAVLSLGGWVVAVGYSFEWLSFAMGIGIFTVNLGLWTFVVRGVLLAAAEAAQARQEANETTIESMSESETRGDSTVVLEGDGRGEGDAELSKPEDPPSRRRWLLVVSMMVKMGFFAGGIYMCLAYWHLSPLYFVGGLISGLMLTAASAMASSIS